MASSNEQLDFSATHMAMETPNRKFASTPSNVDSQWSEQALDFMNGSVDSDDEGKKVVIYVIIRQSRKCILV